MQPEEHNQVPEYLRVMAVLGERVQEARIRYSECRSLALMRCSHIRKEFVDNRQGSRIMDYFNAGLIGGSSNGLTRQEVKGLAETTARRVAGDVSEHSSEDLFKMPTLPLLRKVETLPDSSEIITRAGNRWAWHTCKLCANTEPYRWCGHHRDQCTRNPASPAFGT